MSTVFGPVNLGRDNHGPFIGTKLSLHDLLVSDGVACRLLERLAPACLLDGSVVLRLDVSEADLDSIFEQAGDAADYRIQSAREALRAA